MRVAARALVIASTLSSLAFADGLRVETIEQGSWPAAVADLQRDSRSEGRVVRVVAKDDSGQRLRCGTYGLALEGAGADAFQILGCDPETNSTTVRLAHRTALFDHDDTIARPRAPRITVTRVQSGSAAGGATQGGGSVVSCTADVRPFIDDLESARHVAVTPGRYELRLKRDDVEVRTMHDGWRLVARYGGALLIDYEIYDGKRNEVVIRERVTMMCGGSNAPAAPDPPPATTTTVIRAPVGIDSPRPESPPDAEGAGKHWNGHGWTVSLLAGSAYMRPAGLVFGNGAETQDASIFGLRNLAAPVAGLGLSYERPGIYSSLGVHFGWLGTSNATLIAYGASSTVAAAVHAGDTTLYLGPHVEVGTYQLTGLGTSWGTPAALSVGAATGLRLHLRDDDGKAWVLGGEIVAPATGSAPWFFVASIGWGGAR
jgi:hypothetical protein